MGTRLGGGCPGGREALRRWRWTGSPLPAWVWVPLGAGFLALAWTAPVWVGSGSRLLGNHAPYGNDDLQFAWFLSWIPFALTHGHGLLATHALNAPRGISLLWPAPPILWMSLVLPFMPFLGLLSTYNLLIVVAMAADGVAAYWCCRRWVDHRWAAAVGGVLFMFSPFVTGQVAGGNPNLVAAAMLPLAIALGDEVIRRQAWPVRRVGLALGVVGAVQLLTDEELFVILLLGAGLVGVVVIAQQWRQVRTHAAYAVRALRWAGAVVVPVAVGLALAQFLGPDAPHGLGIPGWRYATDLTTLVFPGPAFLATTAVTSRLFLLSAPFAGEMTGYLGLPMLAVWAIAWRQQPRLRWLVAGLCGLTLLLLGSTLHVAGVALPVPLPGRILQALPVVCNVVPARISVLVDAGAAIVVASFADQITMWPRPQAGWLLLAIVVLAWVPRPVPMDPVPVPAYFARAEMPAHRTLVVVPFAQTSGTDVSMVWQAAAHFRFAMPDGYYLARAWHGSVLGQFGPRRTPFTQFLADGVMRGRLPVITDALRRATRQYLLVHHVWAVVEGPTAYAWVVRDGLTRLLGIAPIAHGGVWVWPVERSGLFEPGGGGPH